MIRKIIYSAALLLCFFLLYSIYAEEKQDETIKKTETKKIIEKDGNKKVLDTKKMDMTKDHSQMEIDCKNCHYCEYPTKADPCLSPCPRNERISIYHSPDEGPTVVYMDEVKGDYGPVMFSHKLHAQMSVMSGGCETCHHYNTTGPVLKCKSCHQEERLREDVSVPDLEAAYHRQCITCHRQWSGSLDCNFCHVDEGEDLEKIRQQKLQKYTGMDHPELHEPVKVVYETDHEEAPIVTFFHHEHTHLFNQDCADCHHDENCIECHGVNITELRTEATEQRRKHPHKSFEEHHQPCSDCHNIQNCSKCHHEQEMQPFNHFATTGFSLQNYHSGIECGVCHKDDDFKGLSSDCSGCHDFGSGEFDHKATGFELDMLHSTFDCSSCHKNMNFNVPPVCSDCHTDMTYPEFKPGKSLN